MTLLLLIMFSHLMISESELKIIRIYDGVEAETRKSQASFQII